MLGAGTKKKRTTQLFMSKAFTRESDVEVDEPTRRASDLLPDGAKNYLTPDGAQRMRQELLNLASSEPASPEPHQTGEMAALTPDKRRRDRRMRELEEILRSAEVVPPPPASAAETVQFGAHVTVREASGDEFSYRIVGVHETDLPSGWISWLSPIAKALMNARSGDLIRFQAPFGEMRLEIVKVEYAGRMKTGDEQFDHDL